MLKQTIVSYKDRGPWGNGAYRGNTSGYLIKDLIETLKPASVFDPMAGSGTTGDVCRALAIPYEERDLRTGWDILDGKSRAEFDRKPELRFDFIFFHPPYWNMITYRDNPHDFSQGTYSTYIRRMSFALNWLGTLLNPGGHLALLLADLRRGGRTWFLTDDVGCQKTPQLVKEFRVIKVQHHTASSGDVGLIGDIAMVHEYCTVYRRTS